MNQQSSRLNLALLTKWKAGFLTNTQHKSLPDNTLER